MCCHYWGGVVLKKLELPTCEGDWSPIAKALCDASSIEGIQGSNHNLQEITLRKLDEVITIQI